ncbi:MAG: TonB-dependent receptor, partial [Pseudomonadota bacterium]
VQDVPLAVTAYSGELLEASGIRDIRGLISVSPSLYLAATQSEAAGANARIRGVGTVGDNPGLESSVGVFIDGVYRSRNSIALSELGEISNVEVLRGPQGTLFGRNVSAGAISVNTKAPEYEFGATGEFTYGNFDYIRGSASLTGPIIEDTLAARAHVVYETRDGFIEDLNSDRDFNDRDRLFIRGQLLYEPTDLLTAKLSFDYSDREETCCAAVALDDDTSVAAVNAVAAFFRPDVAVGQVTPPDPFAFEATVTPDRGYAQDVEDWGVSGQIDYDFGFATLTSITAYREFDLSRSQDIDYAGIDIAFRPEDGQLNTFETFTQELRLNGQFGDLDWLVGAFYSNEDITLEDRITLGDDFESFLNFVAAGFAAPGGPLAGGPFALGATFDDITAGFGGVNFANTGEDDRFTQSSESIAIFTHNIWSVTDRMKATVGLRFTHEEKDQTGSLTSDATACGAIVAAAAGPLGDFSTLDGIPGVSGAEQSLAGLACPANILADTPLTAAVGIAPLNQDFAQSRTEDEVTGTVKLSYNVTDDALAYASYSRGYKAGGFNLDRGGLNNAIVGVLDPSLAPDPSDLEFGEETVDAFEIGFKTTWFDGMANVNVAIFHSEFDDYQLNTFNGLNFVVENIEEVKSTGVELDVLSAPIEGLLLQGGVTYADTRFGE